MAYNKEQIFEQAKKAIIDNNLVFIDEVIGFIPIATSTFYYWELEKSEELKDLLTINRINIKSKLRKKWYTSEAPALQMALYKLTSTPEELKKLSMVHTENNNKNENKGTVNINFTKNNI